MGLAAYLPLEQVFAFHESAETWMLRRYVPAVLGADGAERVRASWGESAIAIFRDRRTTRTSNADKGQDDPRTCTVYTRTPILSTDEVGTQAADVLFDPASGEAWQAIERGDWNEALGYAVKVQHCGRRGMAPWA